VRVRNKFGFFIFWYHLLDFFFSCPFNCNTSEYEGDIHETKRRAERRRRRENMLERGDEEGGREKVKEEEENMLERR